MKSELDRIGVLIEDLEQRLVGSVVFAAAASVAAVLVSGGHGFFRLVAAGAVVWALVELGRLGHAIGERRAALDLLVLLGSTDARCAGYRRKLASARVQHALAQRVRDVCLDAHAHTFSGLHTVDVQTVNAVEADLRQLAAALDGAAGRAPAEAVVRIRLLVSSPASPLLTPHDDPDSRRHAIEHAERLIDRCRADLAA